MLFALPGCNNRSDEPLQNPGQDERLQPMPQSWRGVLPCADCQGIETSLFLNQDGTWVKNERYIKAPKGDVILASWGTWARTAEKLVLSDSRGGKTYYGVKGKKLEMLRQDGTPIASGLNYTLEPVKASLPKTPMTMRGMYVYMADAAVFTDCATGKKLPVDNTLQLEQGYTAVEGSSRPVLLQIEAHLTVAANPDTGKPETTLVPDGKGTFAAGKNCND